MTNLMKKIRHRRFKIKTNNELRFVVETSTGSRLEMTVDNLSLMGIGCWLTGTLKEEMGIQLGQIIPSSKLTTPNHEFALGRLVARSIHEDDAKNTFIGFSTVDAKVPLDGSLSIYFDHELDDSDSPFDLELSPGKFSLASFAENHSSNVDLFSKVHQFNVFMKDWRKTSKFSYMNVRKPSMGQRVSLSKVRRNGRNDYVIMGSNDYLGLASHPRVLDAAKKAVDQYGFGATGSPLTTGVSEVHMELSDYLAKLFQKEKVILFNSGYAANLGLISGLTQAQDLIVADMLSHASIQDGMQLSRATSRFFKHNDFVHFEKLLTESRDQYSGCLAITEGVFSMDGDGPQLDEFVNIAQRHKARVLVDEAHSFGVVGPTGLGTCEKFGVINQTDLIMGTFSKICGGIGGFVATSEEVANWLYFWSRAHMFSVSIPPSTAAAALEALRIFREDMTILNQLRQNIQHFKNGLASLGYRLPAQHESAVLPVVIGDEQKMEVMNKVMMDAGVFVIPIVYPAVSRTQCRFRFTVMATHTVSDLDYVLNVLELAMEKADFRFSDSVKSGAHKKAA